MAASFDICSSNGALRDLAEASSITRAPDRLFCREEFQGRAEPVSSSLKPYHASALPLLLYGTYPHASDYKKIFTKVFHCLFHFLSECPASLLHEFKFFWKFKRHTWIRHARFFRHPPFLCADLECHMESYQQREFEFVNIVSVVWLSSNLHFVQCFE